MSEEYIEIPIDIIKKTNSLETKKHIYYQFDGFNQYSIENRHASSIKRVQLTHINRIKKKLNIIIDKIKRGKLASEDKLSNLEILMEKISKEIKDYLIPNEMDGGNFYEFIKEVEDMSKKKEVCLLIKTNDFSIPWWITKSIKNDNKYWCTMFAIGIVDKKIPESYKPKFESELSIGIITRPTYNLQGDTNIADKLLEIIHPIEKQFNIKSIEVQDGSFSYMNNKKEYKKDFFGVTKDEFLSIIKNANFTLYYGHFEHEKDPMDCYFRISENKETIEAQKEILPSVGEDFNKKEYEIELYIGEVKDGISKSHLLLGGCSTTTLPIESEGESIIQFLFRKDIGCKSIIGTMCPVFSDETQQFLEILFSKIFIDKQPLGFALLYTRKEMITTKVNKIHWFPFSLWGHPLTVFSPPAKFSIMPYFSNYTYSIIREIIENTKSYPSKIEKAKVVDMKELPILESEEENINVISEVPIPKATRLDNIILMGTLFVPIKNDCMLILRNKKEEVIGEISKYKICLIGEDTSTTLMFRLLFEKWDNNNIIFAEEERISLFNQGEFDGIILTCKEFEKLDKNVEEIFQYKLGDHFNEKYGFRIPGPLLISDKTTFLSNSDYFEIFMRRYNDTLKQKIEESDWKIHKPASLFSKETTFKNDIIKFSRILKEHFELREFKEEDFACHYFKNK